MIGQGSPKRFSFVKVGSTDSASACAGRERAFVLFFSFPESGLFVFFAFILAFFTLSANFFAQSNLIQHPESPLGTIRINVSWTSAVPENRQGELRINNGSFSQSAALGNDATGPVICSASDENSGLIAIQTLKPILFGGIQTTIHASPDAVLSIVLRNPHRVGDIVQSVSISQLATGPFFVPFDNQENGLLIERCKGDELGVIVEAAQSGSPLKKCESMVFQPGDSLRISVYPRLMTPIESDTVLTASLVQTGQDYLHWSGSQTLATTTNSVGESLSPTVFELTIPKIEGAFDLNLTLEGKKGGGFSLIPYGRDTKKGPTLARRTIQGVVVDLDVEKRKTRSETVPLDLRGGILETIDPTNPTWWKVFAKNRPKMLGQKSSFSWNLDFMQVWKWNDFQIRLTPRIFSGTWGQSDELWNSAIGSGHLQPYEPANPRYSSFVQLPPATNEEGVSWELYTIPVKEPGMPHLLEIEYLSHVPQTMGISILEQSVSGGIFPNSIDSGISVSENSFSDQMQNRTHSHRILFWPRSKSPMILISNRNPKHPAVYGRIRLYRAKEEELASGVPPGKGRRFAALMTSPSFIDQFSAPRVASDVGVVGAEDWQTFCLGTERMARFLQMGGYDSLIMTVAGSGSALYPSNELRPNPLFDSGVFLSRGEDPIRKDVLKLVTQIFQRESLCLIPMIRFNAPLPLLENWITSIRKQQDVALLQRAEGIYSIGPEGRLFHQGKMTEKGEAPYYNILHPIVQEAMLRVVNELVEKYGDSPVISGLAIELGANLYSQLPDDIYYGMDDETIRRFIEETQLIDRLRDQGEIPINEFLQAQGAQRYRIRALFIRNYCQQWWIRWRAETVFRFYKRMSETLVAKRPDCRLFLVGTKMLDGGTTNEVLFPDWGKEPNFRLAMAHVGVMPELFAHAPGVILLRPGEVSPLENDADRKGDLCNSTSCVKLFSQNQPIPGAVFYHDSQEQNIASLDRLSPFQPTVSQICTQAIPCDWENRRRFAIQMAAQDTFLFFDGGEMLPMGQENALEDWMLAFRKLPPIPFTTYEPENVRKNSGPETEPAQSIQPIVFRYARYGNETWAYCINNAPYHTGVEVVARAGSGTRSSFYCGSYSLPEPKNHGNTIQWSGTLRPYDLLVMKYSDDQVTFSEINVSRPEEICGPQGALTVAVRESTDRLLLARNGVVAPFYNGNFELVACRIVQEPEKDIVASAAPGKNKPFFGMEFPRLNLLKNPFLPSDAKVPAPVTAETPSPNRNDSEESPSIPGWYSFGNSAPVIDTQNRNEGEQSLCLRSNSGGGVISEPLNFPVSGRLCIQLSVGSSKNEQPKPLQLSLVGLDNGVPYRRQAMIAPRNSGERTESLDDNSPIQWRQEVILFDRLPLSGLQEVSLRFDMVESGTVWLDDLRLYRLAFSAPEQAELLRLSEEMRQLLDKNRVTDAMALVNSRWGKLLQETIPAQQLAMAAQTQQLPLPPPAPAALPPQEPPKAAKTLWDRILFR